MKQVGLNDDAAPFIWQTEHRLIHAIELLDIGFALADPRLRLLHVNTRFKGFLPLVGAQLRLGSSLEELLHEAVRCGDLNIDHEKLASWLEARADVRGSEETVRLRGDRWARIQARPTCDGGALISFADVTEYRKRELRLTDLHDRLAGEREDLKFFARHLAAARAEATDSLRKAEAANEALGREIAERRLLEHELRRIANTDSLTGALNRRRFIELTEKEVERANRYERDLSLLMLDIDHFKAINDKMGHAAGDEALRRFSQVCHDALRDADLFARLGGEEFAALLPETGPQEALAVAERLCASVADMTLDFAGMQLKLTVSIGAASLAQDDVLPLAVLSRADKALYRAKQEGRNRVSVDIEGMGHMQAISQAGSSAAAGPQAGNSAATET